MFFRYFLDLSKQQNRHLWSDLIKQNLSLLKKGHKVFNELLENISFDAKFDAITMWDVLNILLMVNFNLNTMKNLLTENGVIFLQIPSSDALAAKFCKNIVICMMV